MTTINYINTNYVSTNILLLPMFIVNIVIGINRDGDRYKFHSKCMYLTEYVLILICLNIIFLFDNC